MTFRCHPDLEKSGLDCSWGHAQYRAFCSSIWYFHQADQFSRAQCQGKDSSIWLVSWKQGKYAQVSDAGLPSISDPGHDLVKVAIEEDIAVVTVPGASAGISALIASGLAPQPHIFYGFLPRKSGQQKQFFRLKKDYPETQIFYESPHRVADTLENMLEVYGDRSVVLVRELTKIYEEYQKRYHFWIVEVSLQRHSGQASHLKVPARMWRKRWGGLVLRNQARVQHGMKKNPSH